MQDAGARDAPRRLLGPPTAAGRKKEGVGRREQRERGRPHLGALPAIPRVAAVAGDPKVVGRVQAGAHGAGVVALLPLAVAAVLAAGAAVVVVVAVGLPVVALLLNRLLVAPLLPAAAHAARHLLEAGGQLVQHLEEAQPARVGLCFGAVRVGSGASVVGLGGGEGCSAPEGATHLRPRAGAAATPHC